jgi:hypothetical protein
MIQGMFKFSIEILAAHCAAPTILFMFWFAQTFDVPNTYGVTPLELRYYMIFSFVMTPVQMATDIFLHNLLELIYPWKMRDYLAF